MFLIRKLSLGVICSFALPAALLAQGGGGGGGGFGGGAPPKNLQVLPKEMTRQQVQALMRTFTSALGVRCDHCHVPPADAPPPAADGAGGGGRGPNFDYSLDTKDAKKVARQMITMVNDINEKYIAGLAAMGRTLADSNKVTCATCHRGAVIPHVDAPPPGAGFGGRGGGGGGGGQAVLPGARKR